MGKNYITHTNIITSLGFDTYSNFEALLTGQSGLKKNFNFLDQDFYTSQIDKEQLADEFTKYAVEEYTPLEKMMIVSISKLLEQSNVEITSRTGIVVATTKGNIDVLSKKSLFFNTPKRAYLSELGRQIQEFFKFQNTPIVLSNACVSGVMAIAVADSLIKSGVYKDVVVVGGDLVSEFVVSGFQSFQAIDNKPCQPYSKNRMGVSLGEAVASVIVTSNKQDDCIEILGSGSCNDANHISGPSRTGEGLYQSINTALEEADVEASTIDYISAHGTATMYNDEMESVTFKRLNMSDIPLNSLKGYYGHTLGAAGLLESVISIESMKRGVLIPSYGFDELGVTNPLNIITEVEQKEINKVLKTASGFGGVNSAIIFSKI